MSEYKILIKNSAKKDLKKVKYSPLKARFEAILQTLKTDPFKPTDSFEKLYPLAEKKYSRRLNLQHRVVYTVDIDKKEVVIWSAWTHYESGGGT